MEQPRPSVTAAVIAATLLLMRDEPELARYVDRASLEAVARSIREPLPGIGWALDHVPWPVLRALAVSLERVASPGFIRHYALRKHLVRTHLLEAVRDGHRQVVLVGAGFDMLSASLPADVHVFEVDLPATQAAKRRALEGRPPCACELTYVPIDLARESLAEVLRAAPGFVRARDTVYVAEGLLMYLERSRVEALLSDLSKVEGRSRLVASIVTPDRSGRVRIHTQRAVVDLCMQLLGERFQWGLRVDELEEALARFGLEVEAVRSPLELDGGSGPRAGEVIVVARGGARRAKAIDGYAYAASA
jgi:methyltransferase (TIGR00027 family)